MSNIIKIKHGANAPTKDNLSPFELGYCESNNKIYIRKNEEADPAPVEADFSGTVNYAENAGHATTADSATSATTAGSATNANHATTADSATNAQNAGHATTADSATSATNAATATSADSATVASGLTDAGASALLNLVYPIGAVYMSVVEVSPATLFGGTWEQIKDKFLLSAGDTYENGSEGGEAEHTLTVDEMPSHNHGADTHVSKNVSGSGYDSSVSALQDWWKTDSGDDIVRINAAGGGAAHNNMPPYLTVYMWKRTA